jgi:hypothetical protein
MRRRTRDQDKITTDRTRGRLYERGRSTHWHLFARVSTEHCVAAARITRLDGFLGPVVVHLVRLEGDLSQVEKRSTYYDGKEWGRNSPSWRHAG